MGRKFFRAVVIAGGIVILLLALKVKPTPKPAAPPPCTKVLVAAHHKCTPHSAPPKPSASKSPALVQLQG
jgi:hypothetical protein